MQSNKQTVRVLFAMALVAALYLLPEELRLGVRQIFEALAIAHLMIDSQGKN